VLLNVRIASACCVVTGTAHLIAWVVATPRPKNTHKQVLARLAQAHPDAASCVFVEDKLSTLEKV
jgi:hypothetical protein